MNPIDLRLFVRGEDAAPHRPRNEGGNASGGGSDFAEHVRPGVGVNQQSNTPVSAPDTEPWQKSSTPLTVHGQAVSGFVYGWEVLAHMGLSQVQKCDSPAVATPGGNGGDMASVGQRLSSRWLAGLSLYSPRAYAQALGNASSHGGGSLIRYGATSNSAQPEAGASDSSSVATAAFFWPERNLRKTKNPDGRGETLWLRDYRIAANQTDEIIKALINELSSPHQVTRIIINGIVAWRQEDTPGME